MGRILVPCDDNNDCCVTTYTIDVNQYGVRFIVKSTPTPNTSTCTSPCVEFCYLQDLPDNTILSKIAEVKSEELKDDNSGIIYSTVFPNPSDQSFEVLYHSPDNGQVSIKIIDGIGSVIMEETANKVGGDIQFRFEGKNLPASMYYYQVIINSKIMSSGKFIIKH